MGSTFAGTPGSNRRVNYFAAAQFKVHRDATASPHAAKPDRLAEVASAAQIDHHDHSRRNAL